MSYHNLARIQSHVISQSCSYLKPCHITILLSFEARSNQIILLLQYYISTIDFKFEESPY